MYPYILYRPYPCSIYSNTKNAKMFIKLMGISSRNLFIFQGGKGEQNSSKFPKLIRCCFKVLLNIYFHSKREFELSTSIFDTENLGKNINELKGVRAQVVRSRFLESE